MISSHKNTNLLILNDFIARHPRESSSRLFQILEVMEHNSSELLIRMLTISALVDKPLSQQAQSSPPNALNPRRADRGFHRGAESPWSWRRSRSRIAPLASEETPIRFTSARKLDAGMTPGPKGMQRESVQRLVFLDTCCATLYRMSVIESFKHRRLKRCVEQDDSRRLPRDMVERIKYILTLSYMQPSILVTWTFIPLIYMS